MSIYQFSGTSPVARVRLHAAPEHAPVALIEASDGADQMLLAGVVHAMTQKGWQALPVFEDGREQLQVNGFSTETELMNLLRATSAVAGEAQVTDTPSSQVQEPEKKGWVARNSLRLAGLLNLVGDTGWIIVGKKEQNNYKTIGGGLYTLGALNLLTFGEGKVKNSGQEILKGTADVIRQETGGLPEGTGLALADAQAAASSANSLQRHAAQNTLLAYTAGAGALLGAGIKEFRADRSDKWGLAYAISSLSVKLGSLLIPEQSRKSSRKNTGIVGWVKEKPLRLFGYGSLITDAFMVPKTYHTFRSNSGTTKNAGMWTAITTASYLMSDFLMAISNKNPANATGPLNSDEQLRIEAIAAETIAKSPGSVQADLIKKTAAFMSSHPQMTGTAETIEKELATQVAHMQKNPWAARVAAGQQPQPLGR